MFLCHFVVQNQAQPNKLKFLTEPGNSVKDLNVFQLAAIFPGHFYEAVNTVRIVFYAFRSLKMAVCQLLVFPGSINIYICCNICTSNVVEYQKSTNMKGKNTIRIVLLAVVASVAFLVLRSSARIPENKACKESLEECTKKKDARGGGPMIWENLSQQFFSSI
jgi:hypothetical protein